MPDKSIIIIGAGIAGLAAGCYAQMNGYRTRIFELHDIPGGLCTAWERNGYIFDGCIHYLFGSGQSQPFYRLWEELGAVQGRPMIDHDEFMRVSDGDGCTLIAWADPDRLEAHLSELSPADARQARKLADGVRKLQAFDIFTLYKHPGSKRFFAGGPAMGRKMLPFVMPLLTWAPVSVQGFAQRFHDPFLRRAFPLVFGWPDIPMLAALYLLAYMRNGNAGFPAGGSQEFARAVERRYLELGGEIIYKAQVERILVEDDAAVGVRLYDDSEHRADRVISAADGRKTLFDMLNGRYPNASLRRLYDGTMPIHSQVQVSFGVNRDLCAEPHWATYLLNRPVTIAGQEQAAIGVKHYCFDPSLAPPGKSAVEVMLPSDYDYWQRIYGRKLYDTEQIQVAGQVIEQLERIYPGIGADVEVTDVATPLSYERYTGNWLGSTCGWLLTTATTRKMILGMRKTLPGLRNFWMAGQWVEPGGGVPMAAVSGRNVIQMICAQDGKTFLAHTS